MANVQLDLGMIPLLRLHWCLYDFLQIYIFGGLVSDDAADRFEVLDTDDGSLTPLKGSNGSLVNQSSLTNIRMACAVGLDDTNEIVIAGGYIGGVGWELSFKPDKKAYLKYSSFEIWTFKKCLADDIINQIFIHELINVSSHSISVTRKNRQMSIRVAQKWFHLKNYRFWHLYKNCLKCLHLWFRVAK